MLLTTGRPFIFLIFVLATSVSFADQVLKQGNYNFHYSAFPSTVLTPAVAKTYQLKRSGSRGIVNITPQIVEGNNMTGIKASVEGSVTNLLGNRRTLEFKEIVEGEVIYYLAEFPFSNEENLNFKIKISPEQKNTKSFDLEFRKKFYVD